MGWLNIEVMPVSKPAMRDSTEHPVSVVVVVGEMHGIYPPLHISIAQAYRAR